MLARARLAQGRILGAAGLLDPALTLDADVSILVEDGVQTSAIEGERLDLDAVRQAEAVQLSYFGGLTFDEIALAQQVSPVTVKRDLKAAKMWLLKELENRDAKL